MRTTLTILFIIIVKLSFGQDKIPFEQIAFDFYRDSILLDHPKKRLTLWKELEKVNFTGRQGIPDCIDDFHLDPSDTIYFDSSINPNLVISNDKRFKIKLKNIGKYPHVYCTVSFGTRKNHHIVTIVEDHKYEGFTYHIELDDQGHIINWCKGGWI